jgi:hypothetical protein
MKRILLATAALLAIWATTQAKADGVTLDDPLHGMTCVGTTCTNAGDNGTFTPLSSLNFGFTISPGPATGDLTLVFGVPTDEATGTLPVLKDGATTITTSLFSASNFYNSGSPVLSQFISLSGNFSPTDNFSNLSAGTLAADPSFSGQFELFTATLTGITLSQTCQGCSILNELNFVSNLPPAGSFITGLFVTTDNQGNPAFVGTAASGHLVAQVPGPIVGAGLPGLAAGCVSLIALVRRRRQRMAV